MNSPLSNVKSRHCYQVDLEDPILITEIEIAMNWDKDVEGQGLSDEEELFGDFKIQ